MDIEEAYTELVLEKTENKTHGETSVGIKDYKELFKDKMGPSQIRSKKRQPSNIPVPAQKSPLVTKKKTKASEAGASKTKTRVKDKKAPGKRTLVKGKPGNGKTTLSRKMAWDWAVGLFTKFAIVFLISLKLMRPGEAIENVIINQIHPLEGTGVTPKSLKRLLESFGNSCLLILDGYDECSLDRNSELNPITKIIKMQNLFYCNILLTSRPHVTAELEPNFQVVARLLGFSKSHAQSFARKFLDDKKERRTALKFASDHFIIDNDTHTCPMILLFTCVLMRNDELSGVRGRKIAPGEVYFRLMRCIYRKYVVRKDIRFNWRNDTGQFVDTLTRVGKIALETLLSGNYFYQRVNIEQELGEDAFEYGFLSGHEDYRLESDETADIIVSFHHTTIQEFLGAIGFLQKLDNGEDIENILDVPSQRPIFLIRPLFLHFCLWLLKSDKLSIGFKIMNKIYESMKMCALKRIDLLQLELCVIRSWYPALDMTLAFERNDEFVQNFYAEILSNCKNTKVLSLDSDDPIQWVVSSLIRVLDRVSLIEITRRDKRRYARGFAHPSSYIKPLDGILLDESTIYIYSYSQSAVDEILPFVRTTKKRISLYCTVLDEQNDTGLAVKSLVGVSNLSLTGASLGRLVSESFTKVCPSLAQINIQSIKLDRSVVESLSGAIKSGKLPVLSHLSITDCGSSLTGKLPLLFDSPWSELTHLDLDGCFLDKADLTLFRAHATLFPKLLSLTLSLAVAFKSEIDETRLLSVFQVNWPRLETLQIRDLSWREYAAIINTVNDRKFPVLKHLCISQAEKRTFVLPETAGLSAGTECLPDFDLEYSKLTHLNLRSFIFSVEWLNAVTSICHFTELHSLDISRSVGITGTLALLLCHSFPSLHTLILEDCELNEEDLEGLAQASSKDRLPKLKYLDLSFNDQIICKCERLFRCSAKWNKLEVLLLQFDTKTSDEDFYTLQKVVESGGLKLLEKLHISVSEALILSNHSWEKLSELYLSSFPSIYPASLFTNIANAAEDGLFPALRSIYLENIMPLPDQAVEEDLNILRTRLEEQLPGISVDSLVHNLLIHVSGLCGDKEVASVDGNLAEKTLMSHYLLDRFMAWVDDLITKNDANENTRGILLRIGIEFIQDILIPRHGSRMAGVIRKRVLSTFSLPHATKRLRECNIAIMSYL